jgi:hypothetical protein
MFVLIGDCNSSQSDTVLGQVDIVSTGPTVNQPCIVGCKHEPRGGFAKSQRDKREKDLNLIGQSQIKPYRMSTKDLRTTFSFSNWVYFSRLSSYT